jgi:hypothetical protein
LPKSSNQHHSSEWLVPSISTRASVNLPQLDSHYYYKSNPDYIHSSHPKQSSPKMMPPPKPSKRWHTHTHTHARTHTHAHTRTRAQPDAALGRLKSPSRAGLQRVCDRHFQCGEGSDSRGEQSRPRLRCGELFVLWVVVAVVVLRSPSALKHGRPLKVSIIGGG